MSEGKQISQNLTNDSSKEDNHNLNGESKILVLNENDEDIDDQNLNYVFDDSRYEEYDDVNNDSFFGQIYSYNTSEETDLNNAIDDQEILEDDQQEEESIVNKQDFSWVNQTVSYEKEENNPLQLNYDSLVNNYVYEEPVESQNTNKFQNKKEYCNYLIRMHVEDYLSVLRRELNQYITFYHDTLLRDPTQCQYNYISILDYKIKRLKFSQVGFTIDILFKRKKEQVFQLQNEEYDSFKDESLLIFLNPKKEFLFTGTVVALEQLTIYKMVFDEIEQKEVEVIIETKKRQDILDEKRKKQNQKFEEKNPDLDINSEKIQKKKRKRGKKKDNQQKQNDKEGDDDNKNQKRQEETNQLNDNQKDDGQNQYLEYQLSVKIDLNKDNAEAIIKELIQQQQSNSQDLVAIEALNYWLPFKYTYLSLKSMQNNSEISFEDEIIKGQIKKNQYFFNQIFPNDTTDFVVKYPQYNFLKSVEIENYFTDVLNRVDDLKQLDITQNECLKYMLTNPISLVQGPPGTGKTYISFEAIKILLETYSKQKNKKPILIIARRNETVNDYLERLINYYEKQQIELKEKKMKERQEEKKQQDGQQKQDQNTKDKIKKDNKKNSNKKNQQIINIKGQKQKQNSNNNKNNNQLEKMEDDDWKVSFKSKDNVKQDSIPFLRLGAVSDKDYERFKKYLMKFNLKQSEEIKSVPFININLQNLISNQSLTSNEELKILKEWQTFENKFNQDIYYQFENIKPFKFAEIITNLLIKEYLSNLPVEKRNLSISKQNEILENWIKQDLSSSKVQTLFNLEMSPQQVKSIDYHLKQMKQQKVEFIDIYSQENYQLIYYQPSLIDQQGQLTNNSKESFYKFINSFNKLSEISYFHIMVISEYARYYNKDQKLEKFIQQSQNFEYLKAQNLQKLRQKQLEFFYQKDVILMTLTQSHISYEVIKQLQPEIIIIDEAAENHESEMAHLLSFKPKHYIQVGDHFQLKPIMQDNTLKIIYKYGFSQFQRLFSSDLPHKQLIYQRRMTPSLSKFVRLFYSDETYKDTQEQIKNFEELYQNDMLIEKKQQDVIFIPHTYQESRHQIYPYFVNYFEAFLCMKIAERLVIDKQITADKISILSMYKGQEKLIKEQIKFTKFDLGYSDQIKSILVTTVDSYQGKENDYIIVSCVKSNEFGSIGFLRQKNRINVAFSRARKSAYYICNLEFLSNRFYDTMWPQIKQLANDGFHIYTRNYLLKAVFKFEKYWQDKLRLKQSLKCMFCEDNCHVGICKKQQIVNKNEVIQQFLTIEERQDYFTFFNKNAVLQE